MIVSWSERALIEVTHISDYILDVFGFTANEDFLNSLQETSNLLKSNPMLGRIESLLQHLPIQYRSIVVHRHAKLIYYLNNDIIRIAAVWDTRREPKALIKETLD